MANYSTFSVCLVAESGKTNIEVCNINIKWIVGEVKNPIQQMWLRGPVKSRDHEVSEQLRLLLLLPAKPNHRQKICI